MSHSSIYDAVTIYPPAKDKPWHMPLYCIAKGCFHGQGLDLLPSFLSQQDLHLHLDHFHNKVLCLLNTAPHKA